jgi:hypothetical protein
MTSSSWRPDVLLLSPLPLMKPSPSSASSAFSSARSLGSSSKACLICIFVRPSGYFLRAGQSVPLPVSKLPIGQCSSFWSCCTHNVARRAVHHSKTVGLQPLNRVESEWIEEVCVCFEAVLLTQGFADQRCELSEGAVYDSPSLADARYVDGCKDGFTTGLHY